MEVLERTHRWVQWRITFSSASSFYREPETMSADAERKSKLLRFGPCCHSNGKHSRYWLHPKRLPRRLTSSLHRVAALRSVAIGRGAVDEAVGGE